MCKKWKLDEVESLPVEKLKELIPEDIEEQFDRLPTSTKILVLRKQRTKLNTPMRVYRVRSGGINLLNGDILVINDMQIGFTNMN